MIKIKSGVYGYKDEHGNLQPKTSKSKPFSLPANEEARLVKRGVAMYVGAPSTPDEEPDEETPVTPVATSSKSDDGCGTVDNPPGTEDGANGQDGDESLDDETPVYNIEMKANKLLSIMNEYDIPVKSGMSKTEMIVALDAFFADDEPPGLGAADPVI